MKKWKILYWFLLISFVLGLFKLPFQDTLNMWDVVFTIINGLFLIPTYGFAYKVAIGSKFIAKTLFLIAFLMVAPSIAFFIYETIIEFSVSQLFFTSLAIAVMLFMFYPIFAYAFRSDNDIWSISHNKSSNLTGAEDAPSS